uniref:Uncharacterized protein n=1 Tax=Arundo donax TaxID=35708 RepID=A0A0A8YXV0_ARUDO
MVYSIASYKITYSITTNIYHNRSTNLLHLEHGVMTC